VGAHGQDLKATDRQQQLDAAGATGWRCVHVTTRVRITGRGRPVWTNPINPITRTHCNAICAVKFRRSAALVGFRNPNISCFGFWASLDNRAAWLGMTAAEAFDVLDIG
jgi:hypothetical protein